MMSMLLSASIVVIVINDVDVVATSGGGGNGNNIGLDYNYMWYNITENLSNVVHKYPENMIPKGRAFGT